MSDRYLDTRELDERRDEIKDTLETNVEDDERRELDEELAEIETIEGYCPDFHHGETLIPEDEFEDYARELAEDIGAIDRDASWPAYCIDWERAASDLAMDYSLVEYQGTSYYVR
jgi:antirestriction protein